MQEIFAQINTKSAGNDESAGSGGKKISTFITSHWEVMVMVMGMALILMH